MRHRRLAEEADPDRGHRDPDLAGGEVLVDRSICSSAWLGAAVALVGHRLEPRPARANERELGRDEEPVDQHEEQQHDEKESLHRPSAARAAATLCSLVLGGWSSSLIRRTPEKYQGSLRGPTCSGGVENRKPLTAKDRGRIYQDWYRQLTG